MMDLEPTKEQRERAVLLENRQWLDANFKRIQQEYAGRYVAVHGQSVVAASDTPEGILAAIKDKYPPGEVCTMLIPVEPVLEINYPF